MRCISVKVRSLRGIPIEEYILVLSLLGKVQWLKEAWLETPWVFSFLVERPSEGLSKRERNLFWILKFLNVISGPTLDINYIFQI